jgi:sugar fermentation stimulation protein A
MRVFYQKNVGLCPQLYRLIRSLIQIASAQRFKLARDIDPTYGKAFDAARAAGIEAIAYRCGITCEGIEVIAPVAIGE